MKSRLIMSTILMSCCAALADFVTIGGAGNSADTTGFGDVGYEYKISEYEVTAAEFAIAAEADSTIGAAEGTGATPAVNVSWYEAAKYCNWLTESTTGHAGAYTITTDGTGTSVNTMTRDQIFDTGNLYYVLPTENEWYKAAYYDIDNSTYSLYANGTDTAPLTTTPFASNYTSVQSSSWDVGSGTVEQNGTYDMMGNAYEWVEEQNDANGTLRGGYFSSSASTLASTASFSAALTAEEGGGGFRIVAVPEPATLLLFAIGIIMSTVVVRFKLQR